MRAPCGHRQSASLERTKHYKSVPCLAKSGAKIRINRLSQSADCGCCRSHALQREHRQGARPATSELHIAADDIDIAACRTHAPHHLSHHQVQTDGLFGGDKRVTLKEVPIHKKHNTHKTLKTFESPDIVQLFPTAQCRHSKLSCSQSVVASTTGRLAGTH